MCIRDRYGDIKINGGTVSAIAYHNEVYAIGVAEKPSVEAVSYTHLALTHILSDDNIACVNELLNLTQDFPKIDITATKACSSKQKNPVSYTHLDVYKRQPFSLMV